MTAWFRESWFVNRHDNKQHKHQYALYAWMYTIRKYIYVLHKQHDQEYIYKFKNVYKLVD